MSLPEYRKSLAGLTELELWYAAKKGSECGHDIGTAVNTWTDLYCFSSSFDKEILATDNVAWSAFLGKLSTYDFAAFMEDFEPRLDKDLEKAKQEISRSYAGFTYEFHYEYFHPPCSGELLTLHFRNYFAPDSPADHEDALAAGLRDLVARARSERPEVKMVQCASWLNNIPFFQRLFPRAWWQDGKDCPYAPSTGWWGQFIDRTGGINMKNAVSFRERGEFKYKNVHSVCAIEDLRKHLVGLLK